MAIMDQIANHLEFLGYQIEKKEDSSIRARHDRWLNLIIDEETRGILFSSFFRTNDLAKIDKTGFLEIVNSLNAKSYVLRFYADKDYDLVMDALFPKFYDKVVFGNFIDGVNQNSLSVYNDALKKYLK
jgi:hypothetical protein